MSVCYHGWKTEGLKNSLRTWHIYRTVSAKLSCCWWLCARAGISVQPLTRMPQIQFLGRILSFVILEAYIYERWKVMNIICSYLSITSSFLSKWGSYFASFAIKFFLTNVFWPWFCQAGWSYFCRRIVSKAKIW